MTTRGVSDNDMPNFSRRARADASDVSDADLASLLAGRSAAPDASAPLHHVADVLAALRAVPSAGEGSGKAAALVHFREGFGVSPPIRPRRRRHPLLSPLFSAKAAAAAAVVVVGFGGIAAAAFAGALPSSVQLLAHDAIGAPSPHASHHSDARQHGTPVGPNVSGRAAYGLCNAYANASKHGSATQKAVAFRNLEKAAGGSANVAIFCAAVPHPGSSAQAHPGTSSHPSSHPAGRGKSHPTGRPSHPGSRPTAHPIMQPTSHS